MNIKEEDLYKNYLLMSRLIKLADEVSAKIHIINIYGGNVTAYLDDSHVDHGYTFLGEERLQELRTERERIISALLERVPESYVDRDVNKITWYADSTFGKISLHIGEALCERVKVAEKRVEKIDPDFYANAPKVTVVEDVYEWKYSDDILGAMNHKEVTV